MREYRAVKCSKCIWQDFYAVLTRSSYPPQCPNCGAGCEHEFFVGHFTPHQRQRLGRDRGTKFALGDPMLAYKNLADRARRRNYRGK